MAATSNIIQPTEKQIEAFKLLLEDEVLALLYGGSIRGGKTFFGFLVLLTLCQWYPNSRWAVIRKTQGRLDDSTIPSWHAFVTKFSLQRFVKVQKKYSVKMRNNSEILFLPESIHTDPELNRFDGFEVNGFLFDEISEISRAMFVKAQVRAGSWFHSKAPRKIIATCNPTDNWVKDEFYTPWKQGMLPSHYRYVPAKITDNPHLPEGYLENLQQTMDTNTFLRYVDGDWDVISDGLIKAKWFQYISFADLAQQVFFSRLVWHCYLDGAYTDKTYNDPTAILIAAAHNGVLYVRYAEAKHIESADVLEWVNKVFTANGKGPQSLLKIEPKASGKTLVQLARRTTGVNYMPAVEYTYPAASRLSLASSKVEKVSAVTTFIASGRCVLVNGSWNNDFVRECANFPKAIHDDRLDCLIFAILEAAFPIQHMTIIQR